ncbi:MAG: hypothetical protein J6C97_02955 [Clostridia bacterium]|nr:hypothetical protein [Clostridia bacterium]
MKNKRVLKILFWTSFIFILTIVLTMLFNFGFRRYEPLVYKTEWGDKYHAVDCSYLHSSSIPIALSKCKDLGLTACSRCGGKSYETILVNQYAKSFIVAIFLELPFVFIPIIKNSINHIKKP